MRKTTFLNIVKFFNTSYQIPTGEDFYDLYPKNPEPTLCYIDEYEGKDTKSLSWMKQFSQGTELNLRIKGGQVMKRANPALIILSNSSLEQVYRKALAANPSVLDPMYKRFMIVEATEPIDNQGFIEALVAALSATTAPEILAKLRALICPVTATTPSSVSSTVTPYAESLATAASSSSASTASSQEANADADGLMESLATQQETLTVSAEEPRQNEHLYERWRQERRAKIREQNKVSSMDLITFKGRKRLYNGDDNDDHLLQ